MRRIQQPMFLERTLFVRAAARAVEGPAAHLAAFDQEARGAGLDRGVAARAADRRREAEAATQAHVAAAPEATDADPDARAAAAAARRRVDDVREPLAAALG